MKEAIDNQLPTDKTHYWGSFDGHLTYYTECECGCGNWYVRYVDTDSLCVPQTLLIWAGQLLDHDDPSYDLPVTYRSFGCYRGRKTRHIRELDNATGRYSIPTVRFVDDDSECREQTLHLRGTDLGETLPYGLPQWLEFFLMAESLIARLEGRDVLLKLSVRVEDHESPFTPEEDATVNSMLSVARGMRPNDPHLLN